MKKMVRMNNDRQYRWENSWKIQYLSSKIISIINNKTGDIEEKRMK